MSSSADLNSKSAAPVVALTYRESSSDGAAGLSPDVRTANGKSHADALAHAVEEKFKQARTEAVIQTEQRMRQETEQKVEAARASVAKTIAKFELERTEYFARVEGEVVQLALAIAAKILHREAQVDPMLVAALVKVATDKMREGSSLTVRVSPRRGKQWKEYFDRQSNGSRIEVIETEGLSENDCMLETELGITNFGLDTQLKEIERGFFDLLALNPVKR
jgi:flagellar assembly protein FliH